jgi:hypothetical protein
LQLTLTYQLRPLLGQLSQLQQPHRQAGRLQ